MNKILFLCLLLVCGSALAEHDGKIRRVDPQAERIQAFINDLLSEQFATRDTAEKGLKTIGNPALPQLRRALVNPAHLEFSRRVERLIQQIQPTLGWNEIIETVMKKSEELPEITALRKTGQAFYSEFTPKEYQQLRESSTKKDTLDNEAIALSAELQSLLDLGKEASPETHAARIAIDRNGKEQNRVSQEAVALNDRVIRRHFRVTDPVKADGDFPGEKRWRVTRDNLTYVIRFSHFDHSLRIERRDPQGGPLPVMIHPEQLLPGNSLYPDGTPATRVFAPHPARLGLLLHPSLEQGHITEQAGVDWGKDYRAALQEYYFRVFPGLTREQIGLPPEN